MITTLSAYKEMLMTPAGEKLKAELRGEPNIASGGVAPAASMADQNGKVTADKGTDAVSVELSASHNVFSAVDDYFNLGRSGRFDAFHTLSPDDKEQFVKIVAELAKSGYMGYEELIVNKKVERHEMSNQINDDRLRDAKVYDRPKTARR